MARTKPVVPIDEVAVDLQVLGQILRHASTSMVLVGGQALAFWMVRYGIGKRRDGGEVLAGVTTDVDFLGSLEHALALAQSLGARFVPTDKRAMSALVGQVRIGAPSSGDYNVDVLHQIYDIGGLRQSAAFTRRSQARALMVQLEGVGDIRVLHPLDVLAARIQNLAGLAAGKGPHTVTQARWAVKVARRALELLVRRGQERGERPGALAAEVFRLACSRAGRIAWEQYRVETMHAIPFPLMERRLPGFAVQAEKMRNALRDLGRQA